MPNSIITTIILINLVSVIVFVIVQILSRKGAKLKNNLYTTYMSTEFSPEDAEKFTPLATLYFRSSDRQEFFMFCRVTASKDAMPLLTCQREFIDFITTGLKPEDIIEFKLHRENCTPEELTALSAVYTPQ